MSRIPLLDLAALGDRQREVYDAILSGPRGTVSGPFLELLHSPGLAEAVQGVGVQLRFRSVLEERLREVAVLVTARHWRCDYEWHAHVPIAIKSGLAAELVDAIRDGRPPPFAADAERTVYEFSRQLHADKAVDDDTHRAALDLLGAEGIVDLTAVNGYYALLAMILNANQVQPPDGAGRAFER